MNQERDPWDEFDEEFDLLLLRYMESARGNEILGKPSEHRGKIKSFIGAHCIPKSQMIEVLEEIDNIIQIGYLQNEKLGLIDLQKLKELKQRYS